MTHPSTKKKSLLHHCFISILFLLLTCRFQYIESFTSSRSSTSTSTSTSTSSTTTDVTTNSGRRKPATITTTTRRRRAGAGGVTTSASTVSTKKKKSVLNLFFDSSDDNAGSYSSNNNNNNPSSTTTTTKDDDDDEEDIFYIRSCLPADVGRLADILTDGFFKHKTNFVTYQFERLGTYLSLDGGLPKPGTLHEIFVACDTQTGKVLGLAEVDARSNTNGEGGRGQNGPYMCNVAVDPYYQRSGIASSLIKTCEEQVQIWTSNPDRIYLSRSLSLKVRTTNDVAIAMYNKLGYSNVMYETQKKDNNELILVMKKQLPPKLQKEEKEGEEKRTKYVNGLLVANS